MSLNVTKLEQQFSKFDEISYRLEQKIRKEDPRIQEDVNKLIAASMRLLKILWGYDE